MTTALKQYIDAIPPTIPTGALASMNAINLASPAVTGTLPNSKLPDSGVTAGTYNLASLTINAKGIVTAISANTITSPVTSVFGRTGTVIAQANDYSIGQITGAGALAGLASLDLSSAYATGRVTYGKMPQVAAGKLLGNPTASSADAQEIALGTGLAFSGSTLSATGTPTVEVTSSPFQMAPNTRYIANMATPCTLILPTSAPQGSSILIDGKGAGGWKVAQNAGQAIHTYSDTTTGAGGSLSSSSRYDNVVLVCITADTDFEATARNGSLVVA